MTYVWAILSWLWKIFLAGLYGQELQQTQDQSNANAQAGLNHAQSTEEAAQVEIDIAKQNATIAQQAQGQSPNPVDPFNTGEWNAKK